MSGKRGRWVRLILGRYADVLDRAEEVLRDDAIDRRVAESDAIHTQKHEELREQIELIEKRLDETSAEVRAYERANGIGVDGHAGIG